MPLQRGTHFIPLALPPHISAPKSLNLQPHQKLYTGTDIKYTSIILGGGGWVVRKGSTTAHQFVIFLLVNLQIRLFVSLKHSAHLYPMKRAYTAIILFFIFLLLGATYLRVPEVLVQTSNSQLVQVNLKSVVNAIFMWLSACGSTIRNEQFELLNSYPNPRSTKSQCQKMRKVLFFPSFSLVWSGVLLHLQCCRKLGGLSRQFEEAIM